LPTVSIAANLNADARWHGCVPLLPRTSPVSSPAHPPNIYGFPARHPSIVKARVAFAAGLEDATTCAARPAHLTNHRNSWRCTATTFRGSLLLNFIKPAWRINMYGDPVGPNQ
jgi:hypothetical protein